MSPKAGNDEIVAKCAQQHLLEHCIKIAELNTNGELAITMN